MQNATHTKATNTKVTHIELEVISKAAPSQNPPDTEKFTLFSKFKSVLGDTAKFLGGLALYLGAFPVIVISTPLVFIGIGMLGIVLAKLMVEYGDDLMDEALGIDHTQNQENLV